MADNKLLPATGTGTVDITVATDEIAGVDYQIIKLADGTLGGTGLIGGDATNGLDVDVTRLPALPAGTNNIGDVDIVSMPNVTVNEPVTVDATDGTFFARSASASTFPVNVGRVSGNVTSVGSGTVDTGTQRVVLPTDQPAVPVSGTVAVTGVATAANQTTQITALQLIDDTVFVLGTDTYTEATSKGLGMGAVRRDADTSLVNTTNEWGPLQMDANGRLKVEAFSGETLPVSLTSTTITGTVAVTQSGTWDEVGINDSGNSITVDAAAGGLIIGDGTNPVVVQAAGADNLSNSDNQLTTAALAYGFDGTNWDRLRGDSTDGLLVNLGTNNDVTITSAPTIVVQGTAANDSPNSGNPIWIGGRASAVIPADAGADGDVKALWVNRFGAVVVATAPHVGLNSDPYNQSHAAAQYTTTQTSTVLVAGGASEKIVVTDIQIQAFDTAAGDVIVYFGTGAYARGTNRAIFDGTFKPSATTAPGAIKKGPFISGTNGDDILVTTTNNIDVTISVWYYIVL